MNIVRIIPVITSVFLIIACNSSNESKTGIEEKKAQLEKLKSEKTKLETRIRDLEAEITKLDPALLNDRAKLVAAEPVKQEDFTHYIELQGKVDATDVVIVTPRGMPAQVKELHVKRGDVVKKGQLLMKLDDAVMLQQIEGVNTQLSYAKDIYNRQKNLWDQGIGSEVQLITAKNSVDALEKQIATLKESWKTTFVYAPISGMADVVNIKVGEIFNGATAMGPQLQLVNTSSMKVITEVPENYQTRVKKGSQILVSVPDAGIEGINSVISVLGATINNSSRAFITEAKIPSLAGLRINQIALVRIRDYFSPDAITVPVNVVQTDESGKYVFVMTQEGNVLKARKKKVVVGENFGGRIEIRDNTLLPEDKIITEGYQTLYDGQVVTTASR